MPSRTRSRTASRLAVRDPQCRPGLAILLPILLAARGFAAERPQYYSIKMNRESIGYAVVSRETTERDGRSVVQLKSETVLRVSLLGQERRTLLESETLLDPDSSRPIRYQLTSKTNDVVSRVESEFAEGKARTWIYTEGEPRGEPVQTALPEGAVILGSNNFAHWRLLLEAAAKRTAGGVARVPVFLPDAKSVDTFELVRGEPVETVVGGVPLKCTRWSIRKANLNVLADSRTGELIQLDLPAQQTTVEMADEGVVKQALESHVKEVLTRHFVPSNVLFRDFLKVTGLEAEIDVTVIGSGVENDVAILTSAVQQFEGKKERDHIVGRVRTRSVRYDGGDSPPFPTAVDEAELAEWLKPSDYIESTHPTIVAKSGELTGGASSRWEAVLRIGKWVHKEIAYTIADTPSARLALETKKGDCGPHSTLMIAMLRAARIPARLVGGLLYSPALGGTFGQHGWVEVHLGKAGWVAVDPTTGEFEELSAAHIKLFHDLGGVLPKSVKVLTFEPKDNQIPVTKAPPARPLAWQFDKEYTFTYTQGNKPLGQETVTIKKVKRGDDDAYELRSTVKLKINLLQSLQSTTMLVVATNAGPHSFERDLSAMLQKVKIRCDFKDGSVAEKISGSKTLSHEMKIPPGTYCFDNNLMACWLPICSQLVLTPGTPLDISTFHPSSLQIIPLSLTAKPAALIQIGGKEVECFECEVAPIKNTFWISKDGRFLKAKQGDMVIEASPVD